MKEERRSISTTFWMDPAVENMSMEATYLFMALLTIPENNMAGCYEISENKLAFYLKMSKDKINSAFRELEMAGKVHRFHHWIAIKNHIKNQKLNGGMAVGIMKHLTQAPNELKLWLYYVPNKRGHIERWLNNVVFNVNQYIAEQRVRIIKSQLNQKTKPTEDQLKQFDDTIPDIRFTAQDFIRITTEGLPFHHSEISNYYNILTLTKWLSNNYQLTEAEADYLQTNYPDSMINHTPDQPDTIISTGYGNEKSENSNSLTLGGIRILNKNSELEDMNSEDMNSEEKNTERNFGFSSEGFHETINGQNRYRHSASILQNIISESANMNAFPTERKMISNHANFGEIRDNLSYYSTDEISQALRNYEALYNSPAHEIKSPYMSIGNFLSSDNFKNFIDENKPMEKFRISQYNQNHGEVEEDPETARRRREMLGIQDVYEQEQGGA